MQHLGHKWLSRLLSILVLAYMAELLLYHITSQQMQCHKTCIGPPQRILHGPLLGLFILFCSYSYHEVEFTALRAYSSAQHWCLWKPKQWMRLLSLIADGWSAVSVSLARPCPLSSAYSVATPSAREHFRDSIAWLRLKEPEKGGEPSSGETQRKSSCLSSPLTPTCEDRLILTGFCLFAN